MVITGAIVDVGIWRAELGLATWSSGREPGSVKLTPVPALV